MTDSRKSLGVPAAITTLPLQSVMPGHARQYLTLQRSCSTPAVVLSGRGCIRKPLRHASAARRWSQVLAKLGTTTCHLSHVSGPQETIPAEDPATSPPKAAGRPKTPLKNHSDTKDRWGNDVEVIKLLAGFTTGAVAHDIASPLFRNVRSCAPFAPARLRPRRSTPAPARELHRRCSKVRLPPERHAKATVGAQ